MKRYIALYALAGCLLTGCNESAFLREVPEDFVSTSNAFKTEADFDMSVNDLYDVTRWEFYGRDESKPFDYVYGTDLVYDGESNVTRHSNMIAAYDPNSNIPKLHWDALYKLIAEANVLIDRSATSALSDEKKKMFEAKGRFFRGFAYRTLGYLYGGVPLELHEVPTPKKDYKRSTREETLKQSMEDVKFAAESLPDIASVRDGEVSSTAAYHLLAEIYLALGMNEEAGEAATKVIDNPAMALMKERFGSRKNEKPGDVYWDLFREDNQNRKSGNTEGIWVIQYETNLPGGGSSTVDVKKTGNYCFERNFGPKVSDVELRLDNGKVYIPFDFPISDYTGGRGIGWGISAKYFTNTVWDEDVQKKDMRNHNHNFVRKFAVNNPKDKARLKEIGIDSIDVDNPPAGLVVGIGASTTIPGRFLYAYQSKCTALGHHPEELFMDKATLKLLSTAGATYTDQYMFRLAETYLLRAEAYLNLNRKDLAAADINAVRRRAHAVDISADKVTLDYILDERMREFGIEEKRRLTLMRTGMLYDRVMKCNPYYANPKTNGDGIGMQKHYNLWPIPQSAIEANTDAVLEQNPEY